MDFTIFDEKKDDDPGHRVVLHLLNWADGCDSLGQLLSARLLSLKPGCLIGPNRKPGLDRK